MLNNYEAAAQLIESADGLFICVGAGMSVDAGVPAFRGANGLWSRSIELNNQTISFEELANPDQFRTNPERAWTFYSWRYHSIQACKPHAGYMLLQKWAEQKKYGAYILSSNIDGLFQKAGFEAHRICECHGSIRHLQCSETCDRIWEIQKLDLDADLERLECTGVIPKCPECGAIARPNINMFNDPDWNPLRCNQGKDQMREWLSPFARDAKLCILEIGAGVSIPPISIHAKHYAETCSATIIRINPEANASYDQHICLEAGALEALSKIDVAKT